MTAEEIILLLNSPSEKDGELIKKAFDFSMKAHAGQVRKSGESYFNHVFETVKILAGLHMDAPTIAAGFLHDAIEDGVAKEDQIKNEFGDEVVFLVNGVTKLGKVKYRGVERHIESLRKFLVATAQDIRVLIIKLADRLHNMRTLEYIDGEKQQRIALETLEIYAPLADRLSIRLIARELEDLSFKYLHPKEYEETLALLKNKEKEAIPTLEKFVKSIKKALAEEGILDFKTDYREKGIYSLWKKLKSHGGDIEKIYDILAIRIFLNTVTDCYKTLGIIHALYRPLPGKIKDYIATPKPNGYQSLHTTVFTGDGSIIEVQIRTFQMHYEAEYGIASHVAYKKYGSQAVHNSETSWFAQFLPKIINFAKNDNEKKETPKWIQDLAESQKNIGNDLEKQQFMKDLKADFFNQRIFVLTPKGEVMDLPVGATPIDFAYSIHSSVGEHTNGARINGKMVSLDTALVNGDIVEIVTREASKPSAKWLDIVKTNTAKRHINNYLEKQKKK